MSQEAERVYTINLGKVWLSPNNQRAKRAINMIKEFSRHHMKTEQIKIDQELSEAVWARGIRSPPRKIRVRMSKTDDGYVVISPYEEGTAPKDDEKPKKGKKGEPKKKDDKSKKQKPAKEAEPVEEPAKEVVAQPEPETKAEPEGKNASDSSKSKKEGKLTKSDEKKHPKKK